MAFATKYRVQFDDHLDGDIWYADIEFDGWGGGVTPLTGAGDPVVIRQTKDRPDVPFGICRTTVTVNFRENFGVITELRTAQPDQYRLKITNNTAGTTHFYGPVEGRRLRGRVSTGGTNQVRANCGIDRLRTVAWKTNLDTARAAAFDEAKDILCDTLANLGLGLDVHISANWFAEGTGHTKGTNDPLAVYQQNIGHIFEQLQGLNGGLDVLGEPVYAYDALDYLLTSWMLELRQSRGRWYVSQRPEFYEDQPHYFVYNEAGVYQSDGQAGPRVDWNGTDLTLLSDDGYDTDGGPAYERVDLRYLHGALTGNLIPLFWQAGSTLNSKWTATGLTVTRGTMPNSGPEAAFIAPVIPNDESDQSAITETQVVGIITDASPPYGGNKYLSTDGAFSLIGGATNAITFGAVALYQSDDPISVGGDDPQYYAVWAIGAWDGTNQYWLDNNGAAWTNVGASKGTAPGTGQLWRQQCRMNNPQECIAATASGVGLPSSGNNLTMTFRLYQGADSYRAATGRTNVDSFAWGQPNLEYLPGGSSEPTFTDIRVKNDTHDNFDRYALTLWSGTGPNASARGRVQTATTAVLDDWQTDVSTATTGYSFGVHWAREFMRQYGISPLRLRLRLKALTSTHILYPQSTVRLNDIGIGISSTFDFLEYAWHLKTHTFELYAREIRQDTVSEDDFEIEWIPPPTLPKRAPLVFAAGPDATLESVTFEEEPTDCTAVFAFSCNRKCEAIQFRITTLPTFPSTLGLAFVDTEPGQTFRQEVQGLFYDTRYYLHFQAWDRYPFDSNPATGLAAKGPQRTAWFHTPPGTTAIEDPDILLSPTNLYKDDTVGATDFLVLSPTNLYSIGAGGSGAALASPTNLIPPD